MTDNKVIVATRQWLENTVIGLNLRPFAKKELVKDRIRFTVRKAERVESLFLDLK